MFSSYFAPFRYEPCKLGIVLSVDGCVELTSTNIFAEFMQTEVIRPAAHDRSWKLAKLRSRRMSV